MPGRKNRALLVLAIVLIAQGALSSALAASRCLASERCGQRVSAPCPMGPCEEMSGECGQAADPKVLCGEGCARLFSKTPAVIALAPDAPPPSAAPAPNVSPVDTSCASVASGAILAPSSRGRPAIWLTTQSLLI